MKATQSLPVLFTAVMALASVTTIAAAQNGSVDSASSVPATSAQAIKADFRWQRGDGYGRGFGKRRGSDMMQQLFGQIDADDDGSITQEEVDTFRANQLSATDTSGDGALSIEEFDTIYRELTRMRMVRAFQRLDSDGDGTISPEEMDARFGAIVKRMDRNGDGAISSDDRSRNSGRKGDRKNDCWGGRRG